MTIQSGTRLGPYEVLSALGAGGMGEVWRARDTRLDRDVAIKVLPAAFAEDAQLRVRFEREAKAISSLNHPHICTLHDVGHESGQHYLVMELIEGDSLAERLQRGPLPPEQVLRFGAQIAMALDAAHRKGVIHRDLKPGNIMLTKSGAKLLDFGLAKAAAEQIHATAPTAMETAHKPLTSEGTIVGTYQYMAPEQLEGVDVDARTDIFALGTVLYEMATGRRAFDGKSRTSIIAAIVSSQPAPMSTIVPMTPPALEHVVRKCLEKDPDERWQSAHDVASELRWISEAGSQAGLAATTAAARRSRRFLLGALAVTGWIGFLAAGGWALWDRRQTEPLRRVFRSDLTTPGLRPVMFGNIGAVVLAPDASRIAFVLRERGGRLAVYDFQKGKLQTLEATSDVLYPFWSPDGRWLGFFSGGKLRKIEAGGGPVQVICDAPEGRGGSWSRDGVILFAPDISGPLMSVSDGGGTPVRVTRVPDGGWTHRNPYFLRDGKRFLFTVRESRGQPIGQIALGSLGSESFQLLTTGSNPQYANGYLFFVRDRNLVAQPFDIDGGKLGGSPVPIAERIEYFNPRDLGNFSVSSAGVLVYRQANFTPTQLAWIDRGGRLLPPVGDPGLYVLGRANRTATLATLLRRDEMDQESVWTMDLKRGTVTRSTETYSSGVTRALPSPSGQEIAVSTWVTTKTAPSGLWLQFPAATGAQKLLVASDTFIAEDWSSDGKIIIGNTQEAGTGFDVRWVSTDDPGTLRAFARSRFNEQFPRLSPDGRWLAFAADDGGSRETYISDFPEGKRRWQVTRDGGTPLLWNSRGDELLVGWGERLAVYPVDVVAGELQIGPPAEIARPPEVIGVVGIDAAGNLLVLKRLADTDDEPLRIIRNWERMLER